MIETKHEEYAIGDYVLSYAGWVTHSISDGKGVSKVERPPDKLTTALGILGMPGLDIMPPEITLH